MGSDSGKKLQSQRLSLLFVQVIKGSLLRLWTVTISGPKSGTSAASGHQDKRCCSYHWLWRLLLPLLIGDLPLAGGSGGDGAWWSSFCDLSTSLFFENNLRLMVVVMHVKREVAETWRKSGVCPLLHTVA